MCFDLSSSLVLEFEVQTDTEKETEIMAKSENEESADTAADKQCEDGLDSSQISLDPLDPYEPSGKSEGPRDTLRRWDKWNRPKTHIDSNDGELVVLDHRC